MSSKKELKRGLFLGRFQPYHKGHHETLKKIVAKVDELIIGVGSADKNYDLDNPFTAGERILMIKRSVSNFETPIYIIPYKDIRNNALFFCNISSLVPPFHVVYSNNPLVIQLFTKQAIEVRQPTLINREKYWGTNIRSLMGEGKEWEHLVPHPIVEVINEIGGTKRIQSLSQKDTLLRN